MDDNTQLTIIYTLAGMWAVWLMSWFIYTCVIGGRLDRLTRMLSNHEPSIHLDYLELYFSRKRNKEAGMMVDALRVQANKKPAKKARPAPIDP